MKIESRPQPGPIEDGRPQVTAGPLLTAGVVVIGIIWTAVLVISLFAPDSVSGTQQEHVPVAALLTWIWGLIASRSVVTTLVSRRRQLQQSRNLPLLIGVIAVVWAIAAILGVFGPELVTGAIPTHVPVAALIAPIAAMALTTTAGRLFRSLSESAQTKMQ